MEIKEVFEPVLNFIKSLQKKDKEPASKQAAKDRLKLVLMQDRASVSPDFFEMMKKEIIDVIKKYIEIDEESLEVELTRGIEAGLEGPALYANIPIKNVKPIAPKSESEEDVDITDLEMVEEVIEPNVALTESEAEQVAESILDNLEKVAQKDEDDADEIEDDTPILTSEDDTEKDEKEEVESEKTEEPAEETEKKKATKPRASTAKKTTTKKPTTTKKKSTTKKATSTKKTTTKKKSEE